MAMLKRPSEVLKRWDEIKTEEKKAKAKPTGLLASIPKSLPALVEGEHISRKAAGADSTGRTSIKYLTKCGKRVAELEAARAGESQEQIRRRGRRFVITVINIARFLKVDPEQALRKTNTKFRRRFEHVEHGLANAVERGDAR